MLSRSMIPVAFRNARTSSFLERISKVSERFAPRIPLLSTRMNFGVNFAISRGVAEKSSVKNISRGARKMATYRSKPDSLPANVSKRYFVEFTTRVFGFIGQRNNICCRFRTFLMERSKVLRFSIKRGDESY